MIDPFVLLAAVLLLAVVALLRFVGCATLAGIDDISYAPTPALAITPPLVPDHATVGATNVTLTVNGTGFVDNSPTVKRSQVQWNGVPQPTQYVSATQLTLKIDSLIQTAGKPQITVLNPGSDPSKDVVSNAADFTVNNPQPQITGFDLLDATVGDPDFPLTVKGSNFLPGLKVQLDNDAPFTPPPGSVTASAITFQMPAAKVANVGKVTVKVTNPDPSDGPGSLDFPVREFITVLFPGPGPNDHTPPGSTLNSDASQGWGWELTSSDDPISHIVFAVVAGIPGQSGTLTFASPRLLKSMEVSAAPPGGNLTVTDNNPSNLPPPPTIDPVPPRVRGNPVLFTFNWKRKSSTVSVAFNNPNSLTIHKITYQGPA